ncbi:hypothetical protein N779_09515 [Vibrio coralliilyticus OCN008]|uniref:hypothetical protein n=1 Tax=Vibrio coralliilyticus TaxID=190893 RepID=UPI00039167B7|nr:hypothetical protein [Vibrio coralliilyticus]ERB65546.1 hypothetical protein N779_09515 [Vibrio coralliilyticus OCN008]
MKRLYLVASDLEPFSAEPLQYNRLAFSKAFSVWAVYVAARRFWQGEEVDLAYLDKAYTYDIIATQFIFGDKRFMRSKKHYEIVKKLHKTTAELDYSLEVFGDELAEREGYKELDGIEAIHFYLVHKFSWLPSVVKSMSYEDIRFVLSEEMHGWVLPKDAINNADI